MDDLIEFQCPINELITNYAPPLKGNNMVTSLEKQKENLRRYAPSWVLDSQDRKLVLLLHYNCKKQKRYQHNPDQATITHPARLLASLWECCVGFCCCCLLVLTTHYHRLTAIVCGRCRRLLRNPQN